MDYYGVLGVSKTSTEADIKKAYRKLALQHHPDKGGDQEKFKAIGEAFSVLGDPQSRREYDANMNPEEYNTASRGGSRSSATGSRSRKPFSEFDAFSMFDQFFAEFNRGDDFFGFPSPASGAGRRSRERDPFAGMMSMMGSGGMMSMMGNRGFGGFADFDDAFGGGGGARGGTMSSFSSSSFSSRGGGMQSKSVSTRTTIDASGRKVTVRETTTVGPDGQRHTDREEFTEQVSHGGSRRIADSEGSSGTRRIKNSGEKKDVR
jgi:curved DNA-binding protein CbpA